MFDRLRIRNWRQFESVDIAFHPRLTVLTGANGSGKTTILHLLNRHWGWNLQYVSSRRLDEVGVGKYRSGFWGHGEDQEEGRESPGSTKTGSFCDRPDRLHGWAHSTAPRAGGCQ